MKFPEYLREHAKVVKHMQTKFLLEEAAKRLEESKCDDRFYIKQLPDGVYEVCYED